MNKNAIYVTIMGDYDELHDPEIITPGWDYICFTNNNKIKSDVWQIRKIESDPYLSNAVMSRKIWLLFHHYLPEYDITIMVSGYSVIKVDLNRFISHEFPEAYQKIYDIAILKHPHDRTSYSEAKLWAYYNKDPFHTIEKQAARYQREGLPNILIPCSGVIIRKAGNRTLEEFCELWFQQILESPRDQMNFPYARWKFPLLKIKWMKFKVYECFTDRNIDHKPHKPYVFVPNQNLIEMCNFANKKGILIEVGAGVGEKTSTFLSFFKQVYAVDDWEYEDIEEDFERMRNFSNNIVKLKKTDADQIANDLADIVYINNNRINELNLWLPKIKNGGFISGSDYDISKELIIKEIGEPDRVFSDNSWIKHKNNE